MFSHSTCSHFPELKQSKQSSYMICTSYVHETSVKIQALWDFSSFDLFKPLDTHLMHVLSYMWYMTSVKTISSCPIKFQVSEKIELLPELSRHKHPKRQVINVDNTEKHFSVRFFTQIDQIVNLSKSDMLNIYFCDLKGITLSCTLINFTSL